MVLGLVLALAWRGLTTPWIPWIGCAHFSWMPQPSGCFKALCFWEGGFHGFPSMAAGAPHPGDCLSPTKVLPTWSSTSAAAVLHLALHLEKQGFLRLFSAFPSLGPSHAGGALSAAQFLEGEQLFPSSFPSLCR